MAGNRPAIELEGDDRLRRAFRNMARRADDFGATHDSALEIVADEQRRIVPRDRGELAGTIDVEREAWGGRVVSGGDAAPYAGFVIFGVRSRGIEPQPYPFDAVDNVRERVADRYADDVGDLVRTFDTEAPP